MKIRFTIFLSCMVVIIGFLPLSSLAQTKPVSLIFSKNLAIPDQGPDVTKLQVFLINSGYLAVEAPTGYFGKQTMSAVIRWQENAGLPQTGFFGPMSRAAMKSFVSSALPPAAPVAIAVPAPIPAISPLLVRDLTMGDTGTDVSSLQSFLITKGLLLIKKPTGTFGELTKIALQKWQVTASVQPTGYFGPKTRLSLTKTLVNNSFDRNAESSSRLVLLADVVDALPPAPTLPPVYNPIIDPVFSPVGGGGGGGGNSASVITSNGGGESLATTTLTTISTTSEISDMIAPQVSITNPVSSSTVTNQISVRVTASDNVKVTEVELYVDTAIKGVASTSPYIFLMDTSLFAPGPHVLIAKAYDAVGNSSTTASTTITVVTPAPSVPQNLSVTAVASSSISLAWSASAESGGSITGYKIYQGNTQIGTSTKISFTHSSLLASTTYSYAVASFDAAGFTSATSTLLATTTLSIPPIATSTSNLDFGISFGDSLRGLNTTKLNQTLDMIDSLGIHFLRLDMQWSNIQPRNDPKFFDWTDTDRIVAAASAHQIKILAILGYTPSWADDPACPVNTPHCAPILSALFAAYAKATVQRYSSKGVSDWEIWNEPNNAGFWGPQADCDAYTRLLKLTYTAIKQADSHATVLTGGLSPAATDGSNISPTDFLSCIYNNGGKNYFDAVNDHPYTFPQLPSNPAPHAWAQMSTTSPSLRSIMMANGDVNKKIWITEFGAPTNGPDPKWFVTENKQSQMLTDAAALYKTYSWAGPLFWYTLKDLGTSTSTIENFFGLTHLDGTPKPAFNTLKNIISGGL